MGLGQSFFRIMICIVLLWVVLPWGFSYVHKANLPAAVQPDFIAAGKAADVHLRLLVHQTGKIKDLELEEYLVGVVAAEMPASFAPEALKAQAVAARTYAVRRLRQGGDAKVTEMDPRAHLSNDHQINQAWIDDDEMKHRWGSGYDHNLVKIRQAVNATCNEIMLYKGEVIDPLYHASCGGQQTENVQAVWGGEPKPYLRSVTCTGHQDRHSVQDLLFPLTKVDQSLGTHLNELPVASFSGSETQNTIKVQDKTETGRVKTVIAQGKNFSGGEIRTLLNLPSTNFQMHVTADGLEVRSNGYGHGVGMCQYGAEDLAAQGWTYRQILAHYYQEIQFGFVGSVPA
jgi:stage II sporulation protein D